MTDISNDESGQQAKDFSAVPATAMSIGESTGVPMSPPPEGAPTATTVATGTDRIRSDSECYMDYVPPPPTPLPPPAKWKLWLLVLVLVYFAVWCAGASDFLGALKRSGWLSHNAAMFLMLGIIVFCMVFAALDILVMAFTWKIRGNVYGIGPWLKGPRRWEQMCRWHARRKAARDGDDDDAGGGNPLLVVGDFVVELACCIVKILEDGFEMFNPPAGPGGNGGGGGAGDGGGNGGGNGTGKPPPKRYEPGCQGSECEVLLKIHYELDPDRMDEYHAWRRKIRRKVQTVDGFKSVVATTHSDSDSDGDDDDEYEDVEDWDAEKGRDGGSQSDGLADGDDAPKRGKAEFVYLTFSNIDLLNEWMTSPRRAKLMKELEPMLLQPSEVQIRRNRFLPDAFTDLVTRQGEDVPTALPKKWKVWWLTTIGLYFCLLWMEEVLPHYFERWGIADAHPRLRSFVDSVLSTFCNSYIMTPLMLFFFSDWLRRKEGEDDRNEPWRTLNDGIQNIWLKVLVFFAFYGGCIIAWAVKR